MMILLQFNIAVHLPLKAHSASTQRYALNGRHGTDVDGLGKTAVLLGDGHGHEGELAICIAGEGAGGLTELGASGVGVGRGIVLGLDLQLTVLDTDVQEGMQSARLGEIGITVALGVHEVGHRQFYGSVDGSRKGACRIVILLGGIDTAVGLDGDRVIGGIGLTDRAEDVGGEQVEQVGIAALDLGHADVPVAVRNHGCTRRLDDQGGGLAHVVTEATGGKAAVPGDDGDHDIPRKGLIAGDGGVGAAVALGGDGDVVGHIPHARAIRPCYRPVHFLIGGGSGLDGGGEGLLEGRLVVGHRNGHGRDRHGDVGILLGLDSEGIGGDLLRIGFDGITLGDTAGQGYGSQDHDRSHKPCQQLGFVFHSVSSLIGDMGVNDPPIRK